MRRCLYQAEWRGAEQPKTYFQDDAVCSALTEVMERLQVVNLSLFADKNRLFLYYECLEKEAGPDRLLGNSGEKLAIWPGTGKVRWWVPMTDIFHYQHPLSNEQWVRKHSDRRPFGRVARLEPEQIASYVYFHYQYQEEKPGDGDKYGIIGLHENQLFFYSELPETLEPVPYEGKLNTSLKPDHWAEVMEPHFIKWKGVPEGQDIWRKLELVLEVRGYAAERGLPHA
ncbi:hypothetical protein P9847_20335 [Paenibacillus chibensis]|uniref:Uncharacterized protein n=1 Tax=Paenibacillus chibensis TaxID=59846 RepID=A0ABU6PXM5_9BACL|nr:hypothetical protein [Paenibacillus chibensis]